jgi:hypothetical protein
MIYRTRPHQMSYGRPIGMLMLAENIPYPPGTPGNPTTFDHPVIHEIVEGVEIASLKALNVPDGQAAFIAAGQRLVDKGVTAITGNCGLMIVHQAAMAQALPVPILMSSLLQIPFIQQLIGADRAVGIIASSEGGMKEQHLVMACGGAQANLAITNMEGQPNFRAAVVEEGGILDTDLVEPEVVAVAQGLVAERPDVGAILFECTDLCPYAAAVQNATGLPVFDVTTLINHALLALVRRPFTGVY